jgi:hypothetical protein
MIEAAGAFDAWGSSVIGGAVAGLSGAIFVLIGVRYAQLLADKRIRAADRQRAAAQLMVEVSNLRDAACSRRTGPVGDYSMYMLRNALFTTYLALHEYPSHKAVDDFYKTVQRWRQWARDRAREPQIGPIEDSFPLVHEYRVGLAQYGDGVIKVLQDKLTEDRLDFVPPLLPELTEQPL